MQTSNEFRSLGEYAQTVQAACLGRGIDPRLTRAATFGNEGAGPDGGYAVPISFAQHIVLTSYAEDSLLDLCSPLEISSDRAEVPKDETTPWGSTGITAAWEAEGNQSTQHKPDLDMSELKLRKLKVLVPVTDEMAGDSPLVSSYLARVMSAAVRWKVNTAIINGSAGLPLGIMNAPSLLVQAKETSQTAGTIIAQNVVNMASRCILPGNTRWLINQDAYPQVMTLNIGGSNLWTPGTADAPNGLLLGRPIVMSDACSTLGTQGDIILKTVVTQFRSHNFRGDPALRVAPPRRGHA